MKETIIIAEFHKGEQISASDFKGTVDEAIAEAKNLKRLILPHARMNYHYQVGTSKDSYHIDDLLFSTY